MDPSAPTPPPLPPEVPAAQEFRKAGFWRRVGACLIDSVTLGSVGWILGFFFTEAFIRMGGWERLIGFAVGAPYFVPLNSRLGGGQTVGKRALVNGQMICRGRGATPLWKRRESWGCRLFTSSCLMRERGSCFTT
jgi:hypothetical protein